MGQQVYGPFETDEMHALYDEGRLAPYSLVAPGEEQIFRPASSIAELAFFFGPDAKNKPITGPKPEIHRYVIISDMKSRAITGIERELEVIGEYYPINPQSWILASTMGLNALRDKLMQQLGNPDHLFIADTTQNKAVWCNYGPETESGIRQTWLKG